MLTETLPGPGLPLPQLRDVVGARRFAELGDIRTHGFAQLAQGRIEHSEAQLHLRAEISVIRLAFLHPAHEVLRRDVDTAAGVHDSGCSSGPRAENVELLSRAVFALIDTLKTNGPSSVDVEKVREQITRAHEMEVKQNGYWLNNIRARDQASEKVGGLLGAYDEMVRTLTAAQIQDAAKRYFDVKNYARFLLLPETR